MKKVFSVLSLLVLVFSLMAVPMVGSGDNPGQAANPDEIEGCTIRANFSIRVGDVDENFHSGQVVTARWLEDNTRLSGDAWGLICMLSTVHHITNWIFYIIMIVVMVMILAGAFMFLTSSGDTDKTKKATKTITFAVIGMVVALLARAIPAAVRFMTGL